MRERLEKLRYTVGPRMGEDDASGRDGKVVVRERMGPHAVKSWIMLRARLP